MSPISSLVCSCLLIGMLFYFFLPPSLWGPPLQIQHFLVAYCNGKTSQGSHTISFPLDCGKLGNIPYFTQLQFPHLENEETAPSFSMLLWEFNELKTRKRLAPCLTLITYCTNVSFLPFCQDDWHSTSGSNDIYRHTHLCFLSGLYLNFLYVQHSTHFIP